MNNKQLTQKEKWEQIKVRLIVAPELSNRTINAVRLSFKANLKNKNKNKICAKYHLTNQKTPQ